MSPDKLAIVRCTPMRISAKSTPKRLTAFRDKLYADDIVPSFFMCCRCGCEWKAPTLSDWRLTTCSNCYGDDIAITRVRVRFHCWGPENGGREEQLARFTQARELVKAERNVSCAR